MSIHTFLKNSLFRLCSRSRPIESFSFGFCYNHNTNQIILPSLEWFNYDIVKDDLDKAFNKFMILYGKDSSVEKFAPALIYFFWKHIYWTRKYYASAINESLQIGSNVKGKSRLCVYMSYRPVYVYVLNIAATLLNSITVLLYKNFALCYAIGNPKVLLDIVPAITNLADSPKILEVTEFTLRTFIRSILSRKPYYFLFRYTAPLNISSNHALLRYAEFLNNEYLRHHKLLKSKVTSLISHDDPSRIFSLLRYCQDVGVKTKGVQHGLYSRYEFGYAALSKSKSCATDYWFDFLYTKDSISERIFRCISFASNKTTILPIPNRSSPVSSHRLISHNLHDINNYACCTIVLDTYADIQALLAFMNRSNVLFPFTEFFLRPHPSMNSRQICFIKQILGRDIRINNLLIQDHAYLVMKSTFLVTLLEASCSVFILPSRLAFTDDTISELIKA